MRIAIIGSGVLGQATGLGLSKYGNEVIFHDIDEEKLTMLHEEGFRVTSELLEAVEKSDVLFICVPTPTTNGKMDLSFIEKATTSIANALSQTNGYQIVAVRSTVLPSTTRCTVIPLLEKYSKLRAGREFGVCMNPEFLRERYAVKDFLNPSRIVIGELDKRSGDILEELYIPFKSRIFRTCLDSAEMIKYVANCFLATKISFFNEVYMICKELGLDSDFISEAASLDPRIGKYGIHGGRPFSGKCLPKDLEAFLSCARECGINPKLLEAVRDLNDEVAKQDNRSKISNPTNNHGE